MKQGRLFVISGPSGVGKSTILKELLARQEDIYFSVSATTRPPRPGEVDHVHYHFNSPDEFRRLIESEALLEWAEYVGNYYGTPAKYVDEALEQAKVILAGDRTTYCVTPNPEIVYEAMGDAAFRQLLNSAAMVLPDGVGVLLGAKILGTPLKEKVSGVDFAAHLLPILEEQGKTLYLLGSKPGVAELAAQNMLARCPNLQICGMADGYFKDEGPVVEAINRARADVLFVCLGSPKQERFMQAHVEDLNVSLMIGLGGSLDAFAGTVRRAPDWVIRIGMEWFYRLCKEPRRWKRMLRLPKFVVAVTAKRLRGA